MVQVVLGTSLLNNSQVAMGGVLPLLRSKFAHRQDIFYINFGERVPSSAKAQRDGVCLQHAL